jgi:hypothetical protein
MGTTFIIFPRKIQELVLRYGTVHTSKNGVLNRFITSRAYITNVRAVGIVMIIMGILLILASDA